VKKLHPRFISACAVLLVLGFLGLYFRLSLLYPVDSDDLIFVDEIRTSGYWNAFHTFYTQVNGRWFSHLYTCAVFFFLKDQVGIYWIYHLLLLGAFVSSFAFFLKASTARFYGWALKFKSALHMSLVLTACLFLFQYEGRWETWLWVCSTGVHLISIAFLFTGFALLFSPKKAKGLLGILLLLAFAAIGGLDEDNAIIAGGLIGWYALTLLRTRNREDVKKAGVAAVGLLGSFAFNLASSGLRERLAWEPPHNFDNALAYTFQTLAVPVQEYGLLPMKAGVFGLMLAWLYQLTRKNPLHSFQCIPSSVWIRGLIICLLTILSFFIPCYALSIMAPPRCMIVGYLLGLLFIADTVIRRSDSDVSLLHS
jgi:hypothetical protein